MGASCALKLGQRLDFKPFKIGKYLLLERLAMGGMAEVYRAKASGAGGFEKQLAIKRILPNYSQNPEFRRMFEYEARLSSMLQHANIVQIYDFVKSGDTYLLALEYIDGKNLRQFINKLKKVGTALPVEYGVFIINEVCKGLDYAHKKKDDLTGRPLNIIHRDMSPQNIMMSYEGAAKIVDFGIAKAKDRVDETRSGVIKGKFGYMSPEQANGEPVDHRTDIFSTAIILWELLTGRRLFQTDNDMATLKLIQECVIPAPSKFNPKVTPELEKIVLKGLTKDLSLRFQSAGNFHRNLQEYLNKFFPSFTQRDIGDTLARVFKEEIESEKKRIEQLHRQSIPFSQGAKTDDESEVGGQVEQPEGEQTASEAEVQTDITQVSREIEEAADGSDSVEFKYSDTQVSQSNIESGSSARPANDKTNAGTNTNGTQVGAEHFIDDETSISTMGQGLSWDQGAGPSDESEPGTNEKTIVEDPSESGTPTEEKSKSQATAAQTGSRPMKKEPESVETENTEKGTRNPSISITSNVKPRFTPEQQSRSNSEASNSRVSGGLTLEDQKGDNRRRESSISGMREYQKRDTTKSIADQQSSKATAIPGPEPVSERLVMDTPVQTQRRRSPQTRDLGLSEDNYYLPDESPKTTLWQKLRSVGTFFLFVGMIAGTVFLYKVYLGGGLSTLLTKVLIRDVTSPDVTPEETPVEEVVPTAQPTRLPSNQGDCTVTVDSDPRGSIVIVGKQEQGTTPLTVLLKCNSAQDITIRKEGYEGVSENVFVKGNQSKVYRTLKRIPIGTVELSVSQNTYVEITEIGLSRYLNVNEIMEIPLRASRKYKVHFYNPVTGIDSHREVTVEDGARRRWKVQLSDDTKK